MNLSIIKEAMSEKIIKCFWLSSLLLMLIVWLLAYMIPFLFSIDNNVSIIAEQLKIDIIEINE